MLDLEKAIKVAKENGVKLLTIDFDIPDHPKLIIDFEVDKNPIFRKQNILMELDEYGFPYTPEVL